MKRNTRKALKKAKKINREILDLHSDYPMVNCHGIGWSLSNASEWMDTAIMRIEAQGRSEDIQS